MATKTERVGYKMQQYIKDWNTIISNCNFDNTYKMAWAKSIVELSLSTDVDSIHEETITFNFKDIAALCLKYYWNQTVNLHNKSDLLLHSKIAA